MENLLTTALTPLLAALGALASGLIGWLAARTKNRAEAERTATGAALDAAGEWQELYTQIRADLLGLTVQFEEHKLETITRRQKQEAKIRDQEAKIRDQEARIRELEREVKKRDGQIELLQTEVKRIEQLEEYNRQLETELERYRSRLSKIEP